MTAISANDVWAVGSYGYGERGAALAIHWDGNKWLQFPSPSPGNLNNILIGVGALSSDDVWAVGYQDIGIPGTFTLIEHWDGNQWSVVPSPNILFRFNWLNSVSGISSNDVWAVGYYSEGGYSRTLTQHWDGSQWSTVPSPNASTENNVLHSVSALSSNDVWAVGSQGNNFSLVEHWDGAQWSIIPTSDPSGSYDNWLKGVAAITSNDVWMVGTYQDHVASSSTLIYHWDGSQLSMVPSPNINTSETNDLRAVSGISSTNVWAVGYYCCDSNADLILHWNGLEWRIVPSPPNNSYLYGVATISSDDVWAVGYYGLRTLTEHYAKPCQTPTPVPTTTATPTTTPTPTPPPPTETVTSTSAATATRTATLAPTPTSTQTVAHTSTPTPTSTSTATGSATPTSTHSPTPCSITFADVRPTDYFYEPVHYLYCRGVISGYADNTFRPYNTTTRGQLAKIVVLGFGLPTYTPTTPTFRDVPTTHPFYAYIETAYHAALVSGYDCGGEGEPCPGLYFRPGSPVTRGQLAKIVVLATGWVLLDPASATFRDVGVGSVFFRYVETAYGHGAVSGYACGGGAGGWAGARAGEECLEYRPGGSATRGQIARIVYLAVTFQPKSTRKAP
ncbi:MAG: S-layer homology domain-containing protein [Chloroflexia bacterium]